MEKIGHLTRYLGFEQSSSRLIFWDLILFYWLSADRSINDTKFPNSPNVQGPSSGHLFQWNTIKNPPRRSQKRAPFRILCNLVRIARVEHHPTCVYASSIHACISLKCELSVRNMIKRSPQWDWDMQLSYRIGNGIMCSKVEIPH